MKTLGERLAALRKEKALTQAEVARRLNMGQSTIAMYERNKRSPDAETLQKLADFFQVSIDFLLGRVDYPHLVSYEQQEEKQRKTTLFLKEPCGRTFLADPLLEALFKHLSGLTPQEKAKLARHLYQALKEIENERIHQQPGTPDRSSN
ncbi:helix-turn-helix domain-containing protein [Moorella sulfitireducens]|uniref:helix-turn-helix domain-containing protein n=1 Tax=Neomoorella sulfitireducens TaxID=2972948 RepID=UPI0021AC4BBC|nr:helix-turn-helix transcriptional regulator [Moorella sulfitireducens]